MEGCVFCRIRDGEIPSAKIYENDAVMAFLDIAPWSKGHTLVVTKRHVEVYDEAGDDDLKELALAVKKVAKAVVAATGAEGYNILTNNRKAAGQLVFHLHTHIIPRFEGDGIRMTHEKAEYSEGEKESLLRKAAESLAQQSRE